MKRYPKQEWDTKIILQQLEAFRKEYLLRDLDRFKYNAFLKQKDYLRKKIQQSSLTEDVRNDYNRKLEHIYSEVSQRYKSKKQDIKQDKEQLSSLEESIESLSALSTQQSTQQTIVQPPTTQPTTKSTTESITTPTTIPTETYKPKGDGEAKRNYHLLLNKVSRLETYCNNFGSEEFSAKEFYRMLNEIENIFLHKILHGDDSKYLWQRYKPTKDKIKEALREKSETAKKTIESILKEGIKDADAGKIKRARSTLLKVFDMFHNAYLSNEDKAHCDARIKELKSILDRKSREYVEEFNEYLSKAQDLLTVAKYGDFHNVLDDINDLRIEFKMSKVSGFRGYAIEIIKVLEDATAYALARKKEDKKIREKTKKERIIREFKEFIADKKEIVNRVKREITEMRATKPFEPKISEKENLLKILESQIKDAESKIKRFERHIGNSDSKSEKAS